MVSMILIDGAKKVTEYYRSNPKVDVVYISGSVSRGWADEYSDIEINVLWNKDPTDEERLYPMKERGGEILDFYPYEDEEWSETYMVSNIKYEISNFRTTTFQRIISDLLIKYNGDIEKQVLLASLQSGIPLIGKDIFNDLRRQMDLYPSALTIHLINEYKEVTNRWHSRYALLERNDWYMLQQVLFSVERNILILLFALNKQFIQHPGFKWLEKSVNELEVKPVDFLQRLEKIHIGQLTMEGLQELEKLLEETYRLIEKEYPEVDLNEVKQKSKLIRPTSNNSFN